MVVSVKCATSPQPNSVAVVSIMSDNAAVGIAPRIVICTPSSTSFDITVTYPLDGVATGDFSVSVVAETTRNSTDPQYRRGLSAVMTVNVTGAFCGLSPLYQTR